MDVATALSLATAAAASAAGGAADAAGQSAWESLLSLVRRVGGRRGDGDHGEGRLAVVDPADSGQVGALTGWLDEQARADEEFAALLRGWAERHAPALRAERSEVRNTVSGSAQVQGPVIQARDIHGGVNLG
ncbi:hypothetical protein [Streptomyces qinglanensis]|uniref:Uncharacterized protein n=1 Tax=Streptomyces qinglanensis TaxID=943816 RepID=A0A1H9N666_9ACTN|nr:hypothetical protein [Streptomyces qinglanensis]SER31540.1 hypothetical protein SAMN05421870_101142 [Streptomyces qinglanensis]